MENDFIKGLIIKKPNEKAPSFVKFKISMKRMEILEWLDQQQGEWINADILETKAGDKYYAKLDTYVPNKSNSQQEPKSEAQDEVNIEDVPF